MTFKKYLRLNEVGSNRILYFIKNQYIPLTPKMLERIFVIHKEIYYHVTDINNTKKLEKLQGTKKQISCFNNWSSTAIFEYGADGINNSYPVTFTLKGSYTFGASSDIFTEQDPQGRRWISPLDITDNDNGGLFSKISEDINKIFKKSKIMKKIGEIDITDTDNKTSYEIIKTYMDITEKVLLKYKDKIEDTLTEPEVYEYNEIMGYNFKIISKKMIEDDFVKYINLNARRIIASLGITTDIGNYEFEMYTSTDMVHQGPELHNKLKKKLYKLASEANIELFSDVDELEQSLD